MIRIAGASLIFLAAGSYLLLESKMRQKQERFVQDILDAIESIENLIRWEKRTLPDAFEKQETRRSAGHCFVEIAEQIKSGFALQDAWKNTFSLIQPEEVSGILCDIPLSGDSTFLLDHFAEAAMEIREFQKKERETKEEKQKLRTALAFSAAGITVILLL